MSSAVLAESPYKQNHKSVSGSGAARPASFEAERPHTAPLSVESVCVYVSDYAHASWWQAAERPLVAVARSGRFAQTRRAMSAVLLERGHCQALSPSTLNNPRVACLTMPPQWLAGFLQNLGWFAFAQALASQASGQLLRQLARQVPLDQLQFYGDMVAPSQLAVPGLFHSAIERLTGARLQYAGALLWGGALEDELRQAVLSRARLHWPRTQRHLLPIAAYAWPAQQRDLCAAAVDLCLREQHVNSVPTEMRAVH